MVDKNTQPLAVITGGASGIGLSAVKRFLDEGYEVLILDANKDCLLYTSPSPRDQRGSRMPSSA